MIDRKKMIAVLECCISDESCAKCQYTTTYEYCIAEVKRMIEDALALLKAQEPRVLTLEEVENALDTVVWVDRPQIMNSSSEFALLASYSRKHEKTDLRFIDGDEITTWSYSDYGKTWRCWSSRPTDEQREAAPWTE